MKASKIWNEFMGIFVHDHETGLYHFGTNHGECNVHLERYLIKNLEESKNSWSKDMICANAKIEKKWLEVLEQQKAVKCTVIF